MNNTLETFGEYPPILYRCFKSKEDAINFIEEGKLRFGNLNYYKNIEDQIRQDNTEGEGSLKVPGMVTKVAVDKNGNIKNIYEEKGHIHLKTSSGNAIYIMSCLYPPNNDISKIPSKFGNHIVKINNPIQFGQEITRNLTDNATNKGLVVECVRVEYNKSETSPSELDKTSQWKLSYSQKPPNFKNEYEYRLVIIGSNLASTDDQFLYIDLEKQITYAELLA